MNNLKRNFWDTLVKPERLALLSFTILMFFSVFGTSLPWQQKGADYYESENTNIINQLLFIFLFISALLAILPIKDKVFQFIKEEKFLLIFILWCILSAVWSDYSIISIKRSFQFFVIYIVLTLSVLITESQKRTKVLKVIISLYIIITICSVVFIPEAIDPKFNTWRGIHNNKNGLSQMALLCFLLILTFYNSENSRLQNLWNYLMSALSVLIIFMAGSSTTITVFFLILLLEIIFKFENLFSALRIGRFLFLITILFLCVSLIFFYFLSSEVLAILPELFGKDMTLTGRAIFWQYLLEQIQNHLLLGYGFGTYWVLGSHHVNTFFDESGVVMNTAHNGYIDLTLQIGLIGLLTFSILVGAYFIRSIKVRSNIGLIVLVAILIGNLTESTLQYNSITTVVFVYFYLTMVYDYANYKIAFSGKDNFLNDSTNNYKH